jgi:branched-chain amino acid transport system permease protein
MVLTFGLASAGENAMALAWGPGPRALNTPYTGQSAVLGPLTLPLTHLYGALVAVAVIVGLSVFLTRTLAGKSVRAVWQDRDGAALCGIDLERVTGIAYGLATASAAAAGVAMSLVYTFSPASQLEWLVYVFLVVIVGGVGSFLGAVVAGIIVGSTAGLAILVIPFAWTPTVLFVALILLLLWRPSGLFRR